MRALRRETHTGMCRDGEEPASQGTSAFETTNTLPRAEQRLLQRIVGIRHATEQSITMGMERGSLRSNQPLKGTLVTSAGGFDQLRFFSRVHGAT